ncbi:hypothetical protein [Brevibacterium otitidis]|uniref:Uncharacterized protein n=1 Tax=Brevibacterium otitidis TaxID=53364 RepID=A0ABV5X1P2_9MICO|nr:hypothetical protein GCM10023233_22490 [Brevibacterium otitidis]
MSIDAHDVEITRTVIADYDTARLQVLSDQYAHLIAEAVAAGQDPKPWHVADYRAFTTELTHRFS